MACLASPRTARRPAQQEQSDQGEKGGNKVKETGDREGEVVTSQICSEDHSLKGELTRQERRKGREEGRRGEGGRERFRQTDRKKRMKDRS